jgi:hypothetical protein
MYAHAKPRPVPSVALWTRSGRFLQMSPSVPEIIRAKVLVSKGAGQQQLQAEQHVQVTHSGGRKQVAAGLGAVLSHTVSGVGWAGWREVLGRGRHLVPEPHQVLLAPASQVKQPLSAPRCPTLVTIGMTLHSGAVHVQRMWNMLLPPSWT